MIVVFYLELEKVFVYSCSQTFKSDSQLMLEAEIYYDYLKKYKPISVLKRYTIYDGFDIDKYVKLFMMEYGVEHVRGGSYSDEFLSENQLNILLFELETASASASTSNMNHKPQQEIVESIIQSYAYKKMTKAEILLERERLETILEQFKKEKAEYENVRVNGSQIIEDIQWIQVACSQILEIYNTNKRDTYLSKLVIKEFITKYKMVLQSLKTIYTICKKHDYYDCEKNIYVKYPQFVLDDFFYHLHRIHLEDSMKQVDQLCQIYEYMTNIIINKMDEKAFDVSSWGEDVEWRIPRTLYLLDKMAL